MQESKNIYRQRTSSRTSPVEEGWIRGGLVDLVRDSNELTGTGCTRRPLTVRRHYLTNESGHDSSPCAPADVA